VSKERVIRIVIEYDGTDFHGWQVQPGVRTVQEELEKALAKLTGEVIKTVASGRTDAGVHAKGQVVSFRTVSAHEVDVFRRGLNALLPKDAAVHSSSEESPDFHARKSAKGKMYRYVINDGPVKSSLQRHREWAQGRKLDVELMRSGAAHLVGTHDFSSFRSSSCEAKSPVREIRKIEIYRDAGGRTIIDMYASAFLKQMARAIVGTLTDVGLGKTGPSEILSILKAQDRSRAGVTAPPQGLYLVKVDY